jgi:ElaB/YqjD/DUF883 family membrane-anchored ribosome-binding protein
MNQENTLGAAKDQLLDDFRKIATDADALLKAVGSAPGEKANALRASIEESLANAKLRMRELHGVAMERTTAAARATDQYVHENPWPLIAGAAAIGFVLGLLVNRDHD